MLKLARTWIFLSFFAATLAVHANAQNTTTHAFLWSPTTGMQDLGSIGGGSSYANGINNAGQIVGYYEASGTYRAFLWTASNGMQDLGTLGGDSAIASGINSAGQVVGTARNLSGQVHAFLWTATSGMRDLGDTLRGTFSSAVAINDFGDITGTASEVGDIRYVAFLRAPPHKWIQALGTLGSHYSYGYALNAAATIAGSSPLNNNLTPYHAFIRRKGSRLVDLGTLGGTDSTALGISSSEQVVGWSAFNGGYPAQAFLWTAKFGMQALPTLGGQNSSALAINSKSQIVGFSDLSQTVSHAVLWSAPNQIQDLGTLSGSNSIAHGINDLGQVIGESTLQ
jgi:probable HAF family extracellular repeat protein